MSGCQMKTQIWVMQVTSESLIWRHFCWRSCLQVTYWPRSAGQQDVVTMNSIFPRANYLLFPQLEEKLHGWFQHRCCLVPLSDQLSGYKLQRLSENSWNCKEQKLRLMPVGSQYDFKSALKTIGIKTCPASWQWFILTERRWRQVSDLHTYYLRWIIWGPT